MLKNSYIRYKMIFLYLIFGVATAFINWISFSICVKYFLLGIIYSNIISWIFATLFAFMTNKIWVFGSECFKIFFVLKELVRFVSTRLLTGLFEIVVVPLLVWVGVNQEIWGIEGIVAKIVVSTIVVVLNYLFSKKWIFKNS